MNDNRTARFLLAAALVTFAVAARVVPHPWNFAPVGAIALFCGAAFDSRRIAFLAPLAAMFVSDTMLELTTSAGYHPLMPVVYATFAATAWIGTAIRSRRNSPLAVAGSAIASSTLFFVITNFAVWAGGSLYPKTAGGLAACYAAAIPFFRNTLASDLTFSAILFAVFVTAERRVPRFAPGSGEPVSL
ncbi:MAG TPA: DUF6580 family putative transport protein [Thermoanaerobaculia bacterium]|nr:DUF6580 family putative transport protein [Thermoanaerobaculia bacterium]